MTNSIEQYVSSCLKKKSYSTEEFTKKVMSNIFQKRGIKLRYYLCPHCLRYHLTSQGVKQQATLRDVDTRGDTYKPKQSKEYVPKDTFVIVKKD